MNVSDIYAKIRNLFNLGEFKSRNDKSVTAQTEFGRTIEAEELFPYGFFAKGTQGKAVVLSQGGNPAAYVLLPVCSSDGAPELKDGDAVLWSKDGGFVIVRTDKTVELNGTQNGGVVKAAELKKQLAVLTARVDGIINALKTAPTAAQDGGASYKGGIVGVLSAITQKEDFSNIESDKVKHGTGEQ